MSQYLLLIHSNEKSDTTQEEWDLFFTAAQESGVFRGGSAIGDRMLIGENQTAKSTRHVTGFMRFDSDDKQKIIDLLEKHPVIIHGGSVELCEMPQS